jgi:hypothetical protein
MLAQSIFGLSFDSRKDISFFKELPWRHGKVVIASAYRTEDPGFESCQGVMFLGIYTLQCCCYNLICIVIVCN